MPQWIKEEEKKETPQKGELLRQAAVILFLLLGVLLKQVGIGVGAGICFAGAAICAIWWILYVKKQKKS